MDRYKARLVAQGYNQVQGINYDEIFSPIVKVTTIRLVIALEFTSKWTLTKLDVKNVFLHGDLIKMIFIEQPLCANYIT